MNDTYSRREGNVISLGHCCGMERRFHELCRFRLCRSGIGRRGR